MPRQPEWLQQVPAVLEALERITTPVIDRAVLEKLLRVHRRDAIRLMHRFGGYQAGRTFLIDRPTLLDQLRKIAAGEPYTFEIKRRERLGAQLAETRRDLAARRIMIDVAPLTGSFRPSLRKFPFPYCPWQPGEVTRRIAVFRV